MALPALIPAGGLIVKGAAAATATKVAAGAAVGVAAGAAATKTGIFSAIFRGIGDGFKSVWRFLTKNGDKIGHGVAVGASALSNSSFETKNKRVTFKGDTPARLGGYSFNVPSVQVANIDKSSSKSNGKRYSNSPSKNRGYNKSYRSYNSGSHKKRYR